jgi:hypothetical protein
VDRLRGEREREREREVFYGEDEVVSGRKFQLGEYLVGCLIRYCLCFCG